jgi:hypothetical protein
MFTRWSRSVSSRRAIPAHAARWRRRQAAAGLERLADRGGRAHDRAHDLDALAELVAIALVAAVVTELATGVRSSIRRPVVAMLVAELAAELVAAPLDLDALLLAMVAVPASPARRGGGAGRRSR